MTCHTTTRLTVALMLAFAFFSVLQGRYRLHIAAAELAARADQAGRVTRAKQLKTAGDPYPQGCSQFVSKVLDIAYTQANDLMGSAPTYVGVNNSYNGLTPGDVVGWKNPSGPGHVAIYIGEPGMKFIDVRDNNDSPRAVVNGYGDQKLYKSSRY